MMKCLKIFLCFCALPVIAQNWNVFNKAYRYNYKFNNSPVVTNVLFADTVKQAGNDTIYTLNRIAVPTYSCPYDNNPSNLNNYFLANMPQFLQRNIRKCSNGLVLLFDTTKLVVIPTCSVNQTWLFDSIYSKSATCVIIGTQNIFGTVDSVRTILVNNIDTIKLSKSFGLVVFPEPYGKNKYYRLSGIENKNSYDSVPFIGEKVPNAWDFYNFNIGDMFCRVISSQWLANTNITVEKNLITAKNFISDAYTYTLSKYTYHIYGPFNAQCNWTFTPSYTLTTQTVTFNALSSPLILENKMYPNMIYTPASPSPTLITAEFNNQNSGTQYLPWANIAYCGLDNNGKFYKHTGDICINSVNPTMPNPGAPVGLKYISNSYYVKYNSNISRFCVGQGFGLVFLDYFNFESVYTYNLTNYRRNGIDYFGQPSPVGIKVNQFSQIRELAYPNPVQNILILPVNCRSEIVLINSLGQVVYTEMCESDLSLNTANFPNGIYLLSLKSQEISTSQKLVIQH